MTATLEQTQSDLLKLILQALEQDLPRLKAVDLKTKFPAIVEFLDWLIS